MTTAASAVAAAAPGATRRGSGGAASVAGRVSSGSSAGGAADRVRRAAWRSHRGSATGAGMRQYPERRVSACRRALAAALQRYRERALRTCLRGARRPVVMAARIADPVIVRCVPDRRPTRPDAPDARAVARDAGLRYATDARPGITPPARRARASATATPTGAHDPRPRGPRPDPGAGHPAGLDRRLDLPVAERPPAGDRPRRPRPQAVPLPRALASDRRETDKFDRMLAFAEALPADPAALRRGPGADAGCRARRCSRRSSGCWSRP